MKRRVFLQGVVGAGLLVSGGSIFAGQRANKGKRYAVVIGVDVYDDGYQRLYCAARDARKFADVLDARLGYETPFVSAGNVKRETVVSQLRTVVKQTQPGDTLLFFFSGHGSLRNNKQYLLLSDTDPENVADTAIPLDTLGELLKECKATRRIFIIDACRTTRGNRPKDKITGFQDDKLPQGFREKLDKVVQTAPKGLSIETALLFACSPGEKALEPESIYGLGFFTEQLIRAIELTPKSEVITVGSALRSIRDSLPPAVRAQQTPIFDGEGTLSLGEYPKIVTRNAEGYEESENFKDSAQIVLIPSGKFMMLSRLVGEDVAALSQEQLTEKVHVNVPAFWMYKQLVTVAQFRKFTEDSEELGYESVFQKRFDWELKETPALKPHWGWQDNHPMVCVTWKEAQAYCHWAGGDLPSQAQWEKVAIWDASKRRLRKYPWGDDWDPGKVWMSKNEVGDAGGTTAVGKYGVSPYGVTDMVGNVQQWTRDRTSNQENIMMRGTSWLFHGADEANALKLQNTSPEARLPFLGFRCVLMVTSN